MGGEKNIIKTFPAKDDMQKKHVFFFYCTHFLTALKEARFTIQL